ncbi:MAG: hypothetical protein AB9842_05700 [Bacteroidales bacterium]
MDTKINLSSGFKITCYILIVIGIVSLGFGFFTAPQQTWANILLNNYYFLALSIGAGFFLALQYISQSGWSAMFKRVPEAMGFFIPIAGIIMLLMYFGMPSLYHWAHAGAADHDALIQHKQPFLNIPFFFIRVVIYFILWTLMSTYLRKLSLKEDMEGGTAYFEKSEYYSKVYIFILALTFSLASFDWIMSIDVHWYSALFALKNFVTSFYHGVAVLVLIIILLNERGYFPHMNESHLVDFSRYLFMLSIVWGYFWFSQFMLIWYANIPEETIYYARQFRGGYNYLFYINVAVNWFLPFILLLAKKMDKNRTVVKWVSIILVVGLWIDLYTQIYPGVVGPPKFGIIEIGGWLGFAGLFILVTTLALSKANLIPKNHPYLEESIYHHVD